ncbi:hypothetical protein [Acinetobacter boissieri]|uniref:Uncharacterized protein n=1 Tax=Acinetobacter boissieri TaxID=1219383 RepID=A0A1G6IKL4_9GAMM|nr:hypothetical protein [Acinetobacter boissieri]SDC06963.1 hypothetical protein SAMN05421733_108171 [Acinetobacter boissieri]
MKNIFVLTIFLSITVFTSSVFADDSIIKLKKRCVKDYPLVKDETDQDLLGLYVKICETSDSNIQNHLLVQAAQKYQQLGKNLKALQLVSTLYSQNVFSTSLTDVEFMAGSQIANTALNKMRNEEVRYLTSDYTYPIAKQLVDSINIAKPISIMSDNSTHEEVEKSTKSKIKSTVKPKPKPKFVAPEAVHKTAPAKTNVESGDSSNPFATLRK